MKPLRFSLAPLCVLLLVYFAGAQDESRAVLRRKLAAEIEKIADSHDGVMGVAIKDLTTGEEILINDQLTFPTGSSIKIPILVELHKQAAEGKYKLTDQRWLERRDKVGGSGVIVNFGDHTSQLSLSDLGALMIVLTDPLTLGVLTLHSSERNAFRQNELQSLESVADICANSIQNAHYVERVKQLAYLDGLTGIFNRRFFELRIMEEIERARRYGTGMAVIMADIDQFKRLNDEFGHLLGDEVLRQAQHRCVDAGPVIAPLQPEAAVFVAVAEHVAQDRALNLSCANALQCHLR